ncbi:MAG: murein biosynthesis integral membrane protein MurJ [Propionibacteriaceae bacterium]
MADSAPGLLARTAWTVGALTLASRIVGFGRWLVFSKTVGDTCLGDAYNAANQLPNVLFEVVAGGVLAGVVVPVISRHLAAGRTAEANRSTAALLTWTMLVLTPVALVIMVGAGTYGRVFTSTSCAGGAELAAALLIMFVPQVWLYGIAVVSAGVLQARHRFLLAAAAPLFSSLVVVGTYLGFGLLVADPAVTDLASLDTRAIAVLGWGTTAGVLALAVTTAIGLLRCGIPLRPRLRFAPGDAPVIARLGVASAAGLGLQQVATLLIIWLAKGTDDPGAVTRFIWANAIYLLPYAVVVAPVLQIIFPRLSAAAEQGSAALTAALRRYGPLVVLLGACGSALLAATAVPVARFFVLGPGSADTGALAGPILAFAPAVIGFAVVGLSSRILLARHRAAPGSAVTVITWLVVMAAALLAATLLPGSGIGVVTGMGASVSIGMLVGAVVGWFLVRRDTGGWLAGPRTVVSASVAALLAGGVPAWLSGPLGSTGLFGAVAGGVGCALLAGVIFLAVVAITDRRTLGTLAGLRRPATTEEGSRR